MPQARNSFGRVHGRSRGAALYARGRPNPLRSRRLSVIFSLLLVLSLLFTGCFEDASVDRYYGKVVVPRSQEFRWSNGGLPRVFDPSRAAAPPDTDVVRALFDGLTEYDPDARSPVPAIARSWETEDGGRTWLFHLREDARWSNGDEVTAADFVRSWRRTLRLGERSPHSSLLENIEGWQSVKNSTVSTRIESSSSSVKADERPTEGDSISRESSSGSTNPPSGEEAFGAVALDARTLRVRLRRPDKNFPLLAAHTVFRPVHELSPSPELPALQAEQTHRRSEAEKLGIVTNGAFRLAELSEDAVMLERANEYWDARSVKLERVTFVNKSDPEEALASYQDGEIDAVTNAAFEPLALKLLAPYEDFRRETFAALNYYLFNRSHPPFDDRRVREALALALDVERLSADALGGATVAAEGFLPEKTERDKLGGTPAVGVAVGADASDEEVGQRTKGEDGGVDEAEGIRHDVERARRLLSEAGYPGGENFPRIRLLINRNEQQRILANAVARMWSEALGVETEVVIRPWEEYEAMIRAGDFDVARKSLVMQTLDDETNILTLFGEGAVNSDPHANQSKGATAQQPPPSKDISSQTESPLEEGILNEAKALRELPGIPIYFASSQALVKPYVRGFETNLLDAPSLKRVSINTAWTHPTPKQTITVARVFTR